jgi:hypothetical protein
MIKGSLPLLKFLEDTLAFYTFAICRNKSTPILDGILKLVSYVVKPLTGCLAVGFY